MVMATFSRPLAVEVLPTAGPPGSSFERPGAAPQPASAKAPPHKAARTSCFEAIPSINAPRRRYLQGRPPGRNHGNLLEAWLRGISRQPMNAREELTKARRLVVKV